MIIYNTRKKKRPRKNDCACSQRRGWEERNKHPFLHTHRKKKPKDLSRIEFTGKHSTLTVGYSYIFVLLCHCGRLLWMYWLSWIRRGQRK